ncbi:HAL/PAL/TAL family ammonia-lyase [Mesoterricola silvestris]|uniref:tyrosine ammonia-lyase n=1 Tax=Mesoterricola silvestris TaxID=2927979 RepID=A0AA48K7S3_9BACT|nr:aromatic amino acid ammonia-lyase [Mesoterricola silvestris]BDU71451.1 histidine ammonia-lyase [Mesoterricola silvestris]
MGTVTVGRGPLCIEDVVAVATGSRPLALDRDPAFRARIQAGADFLAALLEGGTEVYGVTTGYGDSCTTAVPPDLVPELPAHLTRYHGCGLGRILDEDETLAVLVARLNSLAQGFSGVRWELLEALEGLVARRVLPRIPAEGSVGASGDLTPLSYVAATLIGEREATFRGEVRPAREALAEAGLEPLRLAPKEGLAIMNGTAVMTGLACLAFHRAEYLERLCCRLTALAVAALRGNRDHFHPRLFALKPHAGPRAAAARIHGDLGGPAEDLAVRLQDRYSIRCAPHVIGVLGDALSWVRRDVENELNSANDNPLLDPVDGLLLHGGHFYGGHIAFAMDGLKTAVANLADLMDRQLALLVDARYNNGLPQNLSGSRGPRAPINHGLKAVQIGASAWTAEALKLTLPASVFSRSTECHNQDKVSMGTISARDCLRVLELTEQVAAALALAVVQGLRLRDRQGDPAPGRLAPGARAFLESFGWLPFLEEDLPLDTTLRALLASIRNHDWSLYP